MEENTTNSNDISVAKADSNIIGKTEQQLRNEKIEENRKIRLEQYGYVCSEFLKRAKNIQEKYKASEAIQNTDAPEKDANTNEK